MRDLEAAQKLVEHGEAVAVDGYARDTCMYQSDKDTHDQGVSIIEFENGGTAMHSECFVTSISNRLYTVIGDRATVKADQRGNKIVVRPRWSEDVITFDIDRGQGGHGGSDPVMLRNFIACLEGRETPLSDVLDGVWSIAVAEAAETSVAEKRMVEIKDLLNPKSRLLQPVTAPA